MSVYLIISLIIVAVLLLIFRKRMPQWQGAVEGLAINILAACLILSIQRVSENSWNLKPVLLGGGMALVLIVPFVFLQQRRQRRQLEKTSTELVETREKLESYREKLEAGVKNGGGDSSDSVRSGITVYARNYVEDFQKVTQREFGEYIRSFVLNSPPASAFRAVGIDWTELFGAAISATSERYLKLLSNPNTSFKVILLDPRSPVGLEKRLSEFKLSVDSHVRYEENHPDRVYGKILGSTKMIADYHKKYPNQFSYRFIKELPTGCWIMNDSQIVFYLYSRCHKGWDSPVFIANKVSSGIYEFFDQYFGFLWNNPNPCVTAKVWRYYKASLEPLLLEFDQVLKSGCSGPHHQKCPKL